MQTEVTRLLGIEYPIIQGGMAWVAEYKRTDRQTIRCQHHADESLCR